MVYSFRVASSPGKEISELADPRIKIPGKIFKITSKINETTESRIIDFPISWISKPYDGTKDALETVSKQRPHFTTKGTKYHEGFLSTDFTEDTDVF